MCNDSTLCESSFVIFKTLATLRYVRRQNFFRRDAVSFTGFERGDSSVISDNSTTPVPSQHPSMYCSWTYSRDRMITSYIVAVKFVRSVRSWPVTSSRTPHRKRYVLKRKTVDSIQSTASPTSVQPVSATEYLWSCGN